MSERFRQEYLAAEVENGRLSTLLVTLMRLHAATRLENVVAVVHDVLVNFLGARVFGILAHDADGEGFACLSSEGVPAGFHIPMAQGTVAEVIGGGPARFDGDPHPARLDPAAPAVCVPLRLGVDTIGALAIWELFDHKITIESTDIELLRLLGENAVVAMVRAQLFEEAGIAALDPRSCARLLARKGRGP